MEYIGMDHRHGNHHTDLPTSKYQTWFSAIVQDNVDYVSEILGQASMEEKHVLLTLPFNYFEKDKTNLYKLPTKNICYPFHLAVAMSSRKVASLFLSKYHVDVTKTDATKSNVLHCCVLAGFLFPKMEDSICKSVAWLLDQVDLETLSTLMKQENKDGFRPLEFAAQQGCLKLMKIFMESKFYVLQEQLIGLDLHRLHDVTEYETGGRHAKSPLSMLATLDKQKLKDPATYDIIMSPLITGWIEAKIKSNGIVLLIWFMLRVLVISAYIAVDADVSVLQDALGNKSAVVICPSLAGISLTNIQAYALIYFTLAFVGVTILFDIIELIRAMVLRLHLRYFNVSGSKKPISNTIFFAVANTSLIVMVGFCIFQNLFVQLNIELSKDMIFGIEIVRGFVPILAVWSLGFFLQLLPTIGSGIISVQGMLEDMLNFMFLFLLMLLPFVQVFQSYILYNSDRCVKEFSSVGETFYTLFRIMLNSYDVTTLKVADVTVVYVFHVLYVFMVAVLLLNFLIAIMSSSASTINQNKVVVVTVNQLAVVMRLEDRVFWLTRPFYKLCRRFGFICYHGLTCIVSSVCDFEQVIKERENVQ